MAPGTDTAFWSVFTPGPILETLGGYLPIGDIISLSRTCKGLSGIYRELMSRQWDVDVMLKRFFNRPKLFRAQLGLAEALISGSFALEFFERGAWHAQDLDILVVEGMGAEKLRNYLILSEDYVCCEEGGVSPAYYFKHVVSIYTLSRFSKSSQRVRLYFLSEVSFPIRSILEGFWATSSINFLTWNMAYSIFPLSTFLDHDSYLLQRPTQERELPIQKYSDRGWKFNLATSVPPEDARRNATMRKTRKIADRLSWKIPLNTAGVDVPDAIDPVRPDDHISISEVITGIDQDTFNMFQAVGTCKLSGHFVTHYDVKYMRYCGFLY